MITILSNKAGKGLFIISCNLIFLLLLTTILVSPLQSLTPQPQQLSNNASLQWSSLGSVIPSGALSFALSKAGNEYMVGGTYDNGPLLYSYNLTTGEIISNVAVPRSGGSIEQIVMAQDGTVYATVSRAFQPGYLIHYDPATNNVTDLGNFEGEYGYGLTVGQTGDVFVGSCCAGTFTRYSPTSGQWTTLGQTLGSHHKITGLTTDADGWIYAVTGTVFSEDGATLYRIDPDTLDPITLVQVLPGMHDIWNIEYNAYDHALYMTVSTNIVARLFKYDLQTNQLEDLGEIVPGFTDVFPGQMIIGKDGKVFLSVGPNMWMHDPAALFSGLTDLGPRGANGRPLTIGPDGKMYGLSGSELVRNENLYFEITGQITDNAGYPLENVHVEVNGNIALSDQNGFYAVNGLYAGNYTITPTLTDFEFNPLTGSVELPPSQTNFNFLGTACTPEQGPPTPGSSCVSRPPTLNLPVRLGDEPNPITVTQGLLGRIGNQEPGRIRSWFDHTSPNQNLNGNITLYTGDTISSTTAIDCSSGINCYDGHEGIDFSPQYNRQNDYVFAAAEGTVFYTKSDCANGFTSCGNYLGNQVWIDHGDGYLTVYGHLVQDEVFVEFDEQVDEDTIIGMMGTTGNSSGIHLHFEVRFDPDEKWPQGSQIDPFGCWSNDMECYTSNGAGAQYLWKYPLASISTIDASGGILQSSATMAEVTIPSNSLSSPTLLRLMDSPPAQEPQTNNRFAGHGIDLQVDTPFEGNQILRAANSITFSTPITVEMTYMESNALHLDISQLALYRLDEGTGDWVSLPSTINQQDHNISAQTNSLGSFSIQAPLICPDDHNEPNDNDELATTLNTDGTPATSYFDISSDEDWLSFDAEAGTSYLIETKNLAENVDTIIEIYKSGEGIFLLSNDNSGAGLSSQLTWTAPLSGIYFVRVRQANGSTFGCDASYEIAITDLSPDITIHKSQSDIELSWPASPHSTLYEVWRGTSPNFEFTTQEAIKIGEVIPSELIATYFFTDTSGANSIDDYFYFIKSTTAFTDAISNQTGKMSITIFPDWNLISLPFLSEDTSLDIQLGSQLFGTEDPQTADRVLIWNVDSQSYDSAWFCGGPVCETFGDDFYNHWLANDYSQSPLTIEPDNGFWIQNRSGVTETLVIVGNVAQSNRIVPIESGYQLLGSAFPASKPLDDANLPATGTEDPQTGDRILYWDAVEQTYESAWFCGGPVCETFGEPFYNHWLANDYSATTIVLEPGHGFWYQNRHDPLVWENVVSPP